MMDNNSKLRKFVTITFIIVFSSIISYAENFEQLSQRIIEHYSHHEDTLKLKAAHFLLENIPFHFSISNPLLDLYYAEVEKINNNYNYPDCVDQYDGLYEMLGMPDDNKTEIVCDTICLSFEDIIETIDFAFSDWQDGKWAQHLSFDDFCEFLLPYRVGNEKFAPWRKSLREEYWRYLGTILKCDDMKGQSYWAACRINDELRKLRFRNQKVIPNLKIEWPLSALLNIRMGDCYDYAKLTTYVMRACGIPVSLDYTPQWPDRAHNHHWNVLLDNSGFSMPFMGCESNPGHPNKPGRKMAKVYRYTFAYQSQSLYAQNKNIGHHIPDILSSPFVKDVSEEYFKGHTVTVKLNNAHSLDSFAYIAVFNNQEWVPVDFAKIESNRTATFYCLGGDIVYMPVYWSRNGSTPAGDIILLNSNGTIKTLQQNLDQTQTITIRRKYPLFNRIFKYRMLMKNGHFEAADSPDFTNAISFGMINKVSLSGYDTIAVNKNIGQHRYWRYVSPIGGKCNVAELKFIDSGITLLPKHVLSHGLPLGNNKSENAFDDDDLTFYEAGTTKDGWIGADFGEPVNINKIAFLPRNDDNDITVGHTYQLAYFDDGREVPVATLTAKENELVFKNVPTNTVYILHDLDKGMEERIFTYDNNVINWY